MAITTAQIQQLYVAYLGRAADKAGLDYWNNQLNATPATLTLENLRANFVNEQPEYKAAYDGLTRSETVSKIYLNLFGHSADAAGLAYWTTGGGASVNADQLLLAFINGASASDAKVVANKVLVAEVYTSAAGANYTAADAKTIIAGVDDTTGTVTAALTNLENGTLSGIAVPTGVALLKAATVADAAVVSYEASKAASLVALNDKVVALNTYGAVLGAVTDANADGTISYTEALNALTNATALRDVIGGVKVSTAQLQLNAKVAADAVVAARADLVKVDANAVADINAYNAAVAANNALTAPTTAKVDTDTAALQGVIGTNAAAFADANTAYVAAGGSAIADADALFTAISTANTAALAKIDAAFNKGVFAQTYANVKADGVAQAAKDAAVKAQTAAEKVINDYGVTYVTKAQDSVTANKIVADAQSADALVTQAAAETAAHKALADSATDAHAAVPAYAHDLDAAVPVTAGDNTKADLFYFSAIKEADALTLTNFNKGDALYIGEGYTLNTAAKIGADGFVTGSNVAVKEVFFTQAADGTVSVNVETNAIGHVAGAGDNIATITLTGVTSLADVSFSNGVILSSHVA